jgi:hypothetical protein
LCTILIVALSDVMNSRQSGSLQEAWYHIETAAVIDVPSRLCNYPHTYNCVMPEQLIDVLQARIVQHDDTVDVTLLQLGSVVAQHLAQHCR